MSFTIGSLFDGSGGFPLAASMCGGIPKWASEVEPYPIAVTRSRFPGMKHLGSVTDINGGEIEPVDIISFGSPCQDLSVAGKRAGLKHQANGDEQTTRSGLFMEAVRIIKEMKEATNGEYPKWALWENVPGAFSSQKGEDFRVVLEELVRIVEPNAVMPPVPKAGWAYADSYRGDGWSLAYRVFDAQYWGVPQRRRRIYLVLDLRGERAGEVLFERKSLRGYFEACGAQGQGVASDSKESSAPDDRTGESAGRELDDVSLIFNEAYQHHGWRESEIGGTLTAGQNDKVRGDTPLVCVPYTLKNKAMTLATTQDQYLFQPVPDVLLDDQGGQQIGVRTDGKSPTLRAEMHGNIPCVIEAGGFKAGQGSAARGIGWQDGCSPTLATEAGGNSVPSVCYSVENHPADSRVDIDDSGKVQTLTSRMGTGGGNVPMVLESEPIAISSKQQSLVTSENLANTLGANDFKEPQTVAYCMGNGQLNQMSMAEQCNTLDCMHDKQAVVVAHGVDCRNATEYPEATGALQADACHNLNSNNVVRVRYIVRRLTPTECARLQGFADRWGDIDEKSDFTEEEYQFWLNVRNTHAAINGKAVKDYTKPQMVKWYNGLHTDSAEYKLWGNGIALPNALYVMQGIADVM